MKNDDFKKRSLEEFNKLLPFLNLLIKQIELTDKPKEYDLQGAKFLIRRHKNELDENLIEMSLVIESSIFPTLVFRPLNNNEAELKYYRVDNTFSAELYKAVMF
jgi:hypothetical protein